MAYSSAVKTEASVRRRATSWKRSHQTVQPLPLTECEPSAMFQTMQDKEPTEDFKIQVALAFRGFVHQFLNYYLSNTEGASKL